MHPVNLKQSPHINLITQAARIAVFLLSFSLCIGCTLDDDDRCNPKYEWDDELGLCLEKTPDEPAPDTEPDTAEPDTDTQPTGEESGLGEFCMTDADCEAFQATMCLTDPAQPELGGSCTILGCVAADCVGEHACCDCTDSLFFPQEAPICVDNEVVDLFVNTLQCPCE